MMTKKKEPAIVVIAYNRPNSLERLLNSINASDFKSREVNLVISIDFQDSREHKEVVHLAESFVWNYGPKEVIEYKENKGLRNHILSCGDLSLKYGSVIILEDDLIVSPGFYNYAIAAANYYDNEPKIAGISLYSYEYEELGWYQFYPKNLGTDNFFMQWAASWGQLWTYSQWSSFREWYDENKSLENINIPDQVKNWKKSWKKFYIAYLVERNRYFVYPYYSYTTLKDEGGTHYVNDSRQNSVNLINDLSRNEFNFSNFNNDVLKYDVFFQPIKRKIYNSKLDKEIELEFDFFGTKKQSNYRADYICSSKIAKNIITEFSNTILPYEDNITNRISGSNLRIANKNDFLDTFTFYQKGEMLYNTRKIYAIKEMTLVVLYRVIAKILKLFI